MNWKRASKLVSKFEIERTNDIASSDSDIESDEETKIRQMAHRATLKRRPTIALALMSSSEEDEDSEDEGKLYFNVQECLVSLNVSVVALIYNDQPLLF